MKLSVAFDAQPSPVGAMSTEAQRSPRAIASDVVGAFSVLGNRADWDALGSILAAADPALVARLYRPVRGRR